MRSGNFKQNYRQLLALTDSVPVIVWSCLLVALLAAAPLLLAKYYVSVILLLLITAVGVLGLNLLTGTTGLISLGRRGFTLRQRRSVAGSTARYRAHRARSRPAAWPGRRAR